MICSTPGIPVPLYLPEFAHIHVHWVSDAIQPYILYCPLLLLSSTVSWNLLIFMSIESVMLSNHLILFYSFSFCLQSFSVSGSFPMSQCFASSGQSIRASALASVLPMSIQSWFPLGLIGLISLLSKGLLRVFSRKPQFKSINSLVLSLLHGPTLTSIHDCWKNHSFDFMDLYWQSDVSAF